MGGAEFDIVVPSLDGLTADPYPPFLAFCQRVAAAIDAGEVAPTPTVDEHDAIMGVMQDVVAGGYSEIWHPLRAPLPSERMAATVFHAYLDLAVESGLFSAEDVAGYQAKRAKDAERRDRELAREQARPAALAQARQVAARLVSEYPISRGELDSAIQQLATSILHGWDMAVPDVVGTSADALAEFDRIIAAMGADPVDADEARVKLAARHEVHCMGAPFCVISRDDALDMAREAAMGCGRASAC